MNIGEYIRTKDDGYINKIVDIDERYVYVISQCLYKATLEIPKEDIIKHSKKLIDLIEVGDYVNGSKVIDIAQAPKKAIYTEQENGGALLPIVNNRIESILTKEQFEAMEYKVKE